MFGIFKKNNMINEKMWFNLAENLAEKLGCGVKEVAEALRSLHLSHHHLATKEDLKEVEQFLARLIRIGPKKKFKFDWTIGLVTNKKETKKTHMDIKITNEQQVKVTLTPKTDAGKPVAVDGAPQWTVVSGDATVKPEADGLSAMLVSGESPGDTEILVEADADIGEGVETLSEVIRLTVSGATAKNLGLSVGTPELKPS